jgi:hypothetical protein
VLLLDPSNQKGIAMLRIVSVSALLLALAAGSAGASGTSGKSGFFKTKNGKIYCGWVYGTGTPGSVVCGIKGGFLKPKPKNNCQKQHVDYAGNRIAFNATGKAKVQACAGDAGPFSDPTHTKVLAPGKTWKGGGMSCTVTTSTATCKNKSKHGFTNTTPGPYQIF